MYESLYVALAVQLDCILLTADEKLCNALKQGPFRQHIRRIGETVSMETE